MSVWPCSVSSSSLDRKYAGLSSQLSILKTYFPFGTGQFFSGLIMAAPFGAIMASVSCFVLVIASGLVEDIYAKYINRNATEAQLRRINVTLNAEMRKSGLAGKVPVAVVRVLRSMGLFGPQGIRVLAGAAAGEVGVLRH